MFSLNQETKVGLFLLTALAVVLPFLLFIGNIKLFQRTDSYVVDFKDVQALPPKAAVKVAGVEIGKVVKIKLIDGRAKVDIAIDPDIPLYENASAQIGSTGIIGTRFIEIFPGSSDLPRLKPNALIAGGGASGLSDMLGKVSSLFGDDAEYGDSVNNLKATIYNLRKVSESLNFAIGQRKTELEEIVLNIRDLTENTKVFTKNLREIIDENRDDVEAMLAKFRSSSEKLDSILGKIDRGEGTIGALVSDEQTATDVKEAIVSIKETARGAESIVGRFRKIETFWNYQLRADFYDDAFKNDLWIDFVPRKGKFYRLGATNLGDPVENEKHVEYERKNRILAVLGSDWGAFTGYAGVIRSDAGVGLHVRPLWFNEKWNKRFELEFEASDFSRDRVVNGNRLDSAWTMAGANLMVNRWLWIGARVEDIFEHPAGMATMRIFFQDVDLAYFFGFASISK